MTVLALARQLAPRDAASRTHYESRSDGSFEMGWAESARVRLIAEPADWALASLDLDASSGKLEGLEIALEQGTEVLVRRPRGPARSVEFLLADANGVPLLFSGVYGAKARRLLLRPGSYRLSTVIGLELGSTQVIEVGDADSPISVVLP